jgi:RNA polymerase sigma factor (TIGR02999 family)
MEEVSSNQDTGTKLLEAHVAGDPEAAAKLLPLVYEELRALAASYMTRERPDHTLQATALVNEAYLRLVHVDRMSWRGRQHFLAVAATTLRRVLVDYARARSSHKRGRRERFEALSESLGVWTHNPPALIALDAALERLAELSPLQARIVELRFFAGLTVEETAAILELGRDKVKSEWAFARVWLKRELEKEGGR